MQARAGDAWDCPRSEAEAVARLDLGARVPDPPRSTDTTGLSSNCQVVPVNGPGKRQSHALEMSRYSNEQTAGPTDGFAGEEATVDGPSHRSQ